MRTPSKEGHLAFHVRGMRLAVEKASERSHLLSRPSVLGGVTFIIG
jgi:hypothetical protein